MSNVRMRRAQAAIVALTAGALALTACSAGAKQGAGDDQSRKDAEKMRGQIAFADAAASKGPAAPVPGATPGGTIKVYQRDTYAHLDPAQLYVSDQGSLSTLLFRRLTAFNEDNNGKYNVVGDLATDSGEKSDGGKTWTYKLKDGVKFEDGKPITSTDLRHTFERQFADFITSGPTYVQRWLADSNSTAGYRKLLPGGPYGGKHLPKSVLDTPDDHTIVFHFKKPVGDLPYALALAGYGVVEKAKDTKEKYDKAPVASGPYKIQPGSFKNGKGITLVKNAQWDPKTDPTRHQYPDEFDIQFSVSYIDSTQRLMADNTDNQTAISFNNQVDAASLQRVANDPKIKARSTSGYQPYVGVMNFNMRRLKDKRIREAIAYAMPIQSILDAYGTPGGGELAGSYISPTLTGYKNIDPYGKLKNPLGDVAKAKAILKKAGKLGMKLTYAHNTAVEPAKYSVAVADNLKKAGFDVQNKELPSDTYYDIIGKTDNQFDVYPSAWGADWPSALTVLPPVYDGRQIQDGGTNYALYNNPETNKEIDRISQETDQKKAAADWFALGEKILKDDLPQIPTFYYKQVQLHGSKIGGVMNNNILSAIDPTKLYVKK
ncbi:ABC transporter substrate-binding protein [Streptomyces gilvosporeus]|uniref:ABC transporter n=1 Tax=Streptomyces gilvosporeus TaxID=553510 RepID=A0A1V0TWF0_9ACTN|nr:ABC transporter substrate-binding protein [Streptomyces gilvosporeus]ARF57241.1 ABC transporter [Streptomyces gilvosporeus]